MSALFLSDLVRKVAGLNAGRLNLIICPLIYVGASYWLPGQHDMSASQFLVAALWCHVRGYERNTWSWQIGAGLLLGAAMLNKPTVGVMGVLFPLQALLAGTPVRSVLAHTAVAGVASVAALLAALGAVLARGAALSDVIDCLYTYNVVSQFLDARPLSEIAYLALFFHFRWWPVVTLGSLPAVFWILRGPPRSIGTTALPILWICGVLSYFIQWTTHAYHLAPSFLALAAGLAISVTLVATGQVSFASGARGRKFGAGFIALALIGIGFKLVFSYYTLPQALWTGDHREHLSRFEAGDGLSVAETVAFMPRLGAVPSKDCLLMVGTNSALNYLAMRPEPTRFYHFPVLFLTRSPLPMTERWINQWEADLKAAECRFALVGQRWVHRDNWLEGPSRAAGALREFLKGYAQSGVLGANGGMKVYERR